MSQKDNTLFSDITGNNPYPLITTQVTQIQSSFQNILKTLDHNKNGFAQTANYWGELALWKKVLGGLALALPPFAAGIAVHVGTVLALSGFITVGYTAGSLVLDEYHRCNKQLVDTLKTNLLSLASILSMTLTALESIRKGFELESQKFKAQNEALATQVGSLHGEIET